MPNPPEQTTAQREGGREFESGRWMSSIGRHSPLYSEKLHNWAAKIVSSHPTLARMEMEYLVALLDTDVGVAGLPSGEQKRGLLESFCLHNQNLPNMEEVAKNKDLLATILLEEETGAEQIRTFLTDYKGSPSSDWELLMNRNVEVRSPIARKMNLNLDDYQDHLRLITPSDFFKPEAKDLITFLQQISKPYYPATPLSLDLMRFVLHKHSDWPAVHKSLIDSMNSMSPSLAPTLAPTTSSASAPPTSSTLAQKTSPAPTIFSVSAPKTALVPYSKNKSDSAAKTAQVPAPKTSTASPPAPAPKTPAKAKAPAPKIPTSAPALKTALVPNSENTSDSAPKILQVPAPKTSTAPALKTPAKAKAPAPKIPASAPAPKIPASAPALKTALVPNSENTSDSAPKILQVPAPKTSAAPAPALITSQAPLPKTPASASKLYAAPVPKTPGSVDRQSKNTLGTEKEQQKRNKKDKKETGSLCSGPAIAPKRSANDLKEDDKTPANVPEKKLKLGSGPPSASSTSGSAAPQAQGLPKRPRSSGLSAAAPIQFVPAIPRPTSLATSQHLAQLPILTPYSSLAHSATTAPPPILTPYSSSAPSANVASSPGRSPITSPSLAPSSPPMLSPNLLPVGSAIPLRASTPAQVDEPPSSRRNRNIQPRYVDVEEDEDDVEDKMEIKREVKEEVDDDETCECAAGAHCLWADWKNAHDIEWVCCGLCDKWYHTFCVLLDNKAYGEAEIFTCCGVNQTEDARLCVSGDIHQIYDSISGLRPHPSRRLAAPLIDMLQKIVPITPCPVFQIPSSAPAPSNNAPSTSSQSSSQK